MTTDTKAPSFREALEPGPCPKCGCNSYIAGEPYWKHDGRWGAAACVTCDKCDHEWDARLVLATPPAPTPSAEVRIKCIRAIARKAFDPSDFEINGTPIYHIAEWKAAERALDEVLALLPDAAAIRAAAFEEAALTDVAVERKRQREVEGWTPEHDDGHNDGELARAAAAYALAGAASDFHRNARSQNEKLLREYENYTFSQFRQIWPWDWTWWKPKDRRRDLVRAGALIVAEIERIDRAGAVNVEGVK